MKANFSWSQASSPAVVCVLPSDALSHPLTTTSQLSLPTQSFHMLPATMKKNKAMEAKKPWNQEKAFGLEVKSRCPLECLNAISECLSSSTDSASNSGFSSRSLQEAAEHSSRFGPCLSVADPDCVPDSQLWPGPARHLGSCEHLGSEPGNGGLYFSLLLFLCLSALQISKINSKNFKKVISQKQIVEGWLPDPWKDEWREKLNRHRGALEQEE